MQTRDGPMLQRASSEIQSAFSDFPDFEPTVLFVATWNEVGMANSRFRLVSSVAFILCCCTCCIGYCHQATATIDTAILSATDCQVL